MLFLVEQDSLRPFRLLAQMRRIQKLILLNCHANALYADFSPQWVEKVAFGRGDYMSIGASR